VSGLDQTHDEMVRRLDEESAKNEARMEMALDSVDTEALQIEEDAEDLRAQQVVDEFKAEMGMGDEEEPVEEETIDVPEDEEMEEPSKTIGQQRSKSE